jgi:selenide,water dikinase
VLAQLPAVRDPNLLVGASTSDDAAVYRLSPSQAIVQTIDIFTPVVDDPADYGAIAAANSLSDVYAMGAKPFLALNFLAYPVGRLPDEIVGEIVRGGLTKMSEAGVLVAGGHSVDDPQPKFGYAVTGMVHPDRVVTNSGARPGDRLVLTKPLGIGVLTTGIKRGETPEDAAAEAIRVMLRLNDAAARAMIEAGVRACTDVTGYGLVGHLHEMLAGSGVAARLHAAAVPVIPGAWELAERGVVPGGSARNRRLANRYMHTDEGVTELQLTLLCDAQTSGGLLMAVAADRLATLLAGLRREGVPWIAPIGEVISSEEGREAGRIFVEP